MTTTFHIQGLGAYAPARHITNEELSSWVDTNDEWIVTRTGIKARHMLADGEQCSDAGCIAAKQALDNAGLTPSDITHVLFATCTPDHLCPSTACITSGKLGIPSAMALDINAACSGFVYGLDMARALLYTHPHAKILLISAEALTRRLNWHDRTTCVLFGDGAGAVVLSNEPRSDKQTFLGATVEDVLCSADGSQASLLTVGGGTSHRYEPTDPVGDAFYLHMEGREVFKNAVRNLTRVCQDILERNNVSLDAIDLFIPHQANMRIIEAVGDRLGLPAEKIFVNLESYGNTSAASIPLALTDAHAQAVIKPGARVLLATFGGGFTWGASLLRF